jgi:hypothetical protein
MRRFLHPTFAACFGFGVPWAILAGCSGDHDLLAEKPDATMSNDVTIIYGNTGGTATVDSGAVIDDGGDPEPPGPWVLTWVNGVVDEESTQVCFVPVLNGKEVPPDLPPMPSGQGLAFGSKLVLGSIPLIDPSIDDVHPYLVPKSAGWDPGMTCASLLGDSSADAASRGALSLPTIPAGTLSARHSYLAVATGCTHPIAIVDGGLDGSPASDMPMPSGDTVCGPDSTSANASLVLVRLSRLRVAPRVGFQFVHASAATPEAMLVLAHGVTGNTLLSIGKLGFGQIAPPNEAKLVSSIDLFPNPGTASVRIATTGTIPFPPVDVPLSDILGQSGLDEKTFDQTDTFTLVLLGARPGKAPPSPWHAFEPVIVENAPVGINDGG